MALISANSRCAICDESLSRPYTATSGCAFGPGHRLFVFCDAPLHLSCLEVWPDREEFSLAYHTQALDACRAGYGTLIHVGESWFLGCGPSTPPERPYFARVVLRDWPIWLYTRFEAWDTFVMEGYRAGLVGAALARADAVMTEVRITLPDQRSLQEAWKARR
jgi:hypothetical protein